ncbi:MAG: rnr [Bacteroidetes bacterium]|jgi:ribonuclease R|nr:rnr [Bacteroidota bacterium]
MSKANKPKQRYLFEEVADLMKHNAGKALNYKQIAAGLEITSESERFLVIEVLEKLLQEGFIIEKEKGKYSYKENKSYVSGVIDFTATGAAYVVVANSEHDIYISEKKTKDALQGDLVKVYVLPGSRRKKEGEVVEVITRKRSEYVGTIQLTGKTCFFIPDNNKIHVDFYIPFENVKNVEHGYKVMVRIVDWKPGKSNPTAEIIQVFGKPGEHKTEMNAIMAEFGLPPHFPPEVEKAAKQINTTITETEIARRRDFRNITTFTIDPIDAKDFDDALSLEKLPNGNYEIGVHIADVTHYLKPDSILDKEAVQRATSVYLVDRVIPMLPEVLSNFVCSLRPHEEKYCFSAVFEMDEEAKVVNEWYGKTIIYSDRRFAYEEVQQVIETGEGDYKEEIFVLDRLAKKLRAERTRKGSIFFDKEEVKFQLDEEGNPLGVFFKVQQDAHKLIEDFMLLANRKVAELLGKPKSDNAKKSGKKHEGPPMVYRIHDVPSSEKLSGLNEFVGKFGYNVSLKDKQSTAQSINKLLAEVKGKKEASMIELLTLRSMPKAVYTIQNVGHYGLGFDYYTHFTSPIRRYPDVLVHRLLEAHLKGFTYSDANELEMLSKHSSDMERTAADAERASIKFKQVEFMEDKVGQSFKGVISGVTEWGVYVEIIENKCEGMIRMRDMKDDSYYFDEDNYRYIGRNKNTVYALGDVVWVEVKKADLQRKQLDYAFVSNPDGKTEKTDSSKGPGGNSNSRDNRSPRGQEKKTWPSGKPKRKK